jgi:hypothetical protein
MSAPDMASWRRYGLQVEVGGAVELALEVAGSRETVTVSGAAPMVETLPAAISSVRERARFSGLALLTPGVTQDPRSLTSATNGDLAFGGIRGFQTSFLVDGVDNNNTFFG